MRGQRKQKETKRARIIQRSMESIGNVIVPHGDKVLSAFLQAIKKTRSYTLAGDFDSCVKNALEREKNL